MDINHDHFGFYLAWGDLVFLPAFYTLQAQYLARFPTDLSDLHSLSILIIGIGGYCIFRGANHQRDYVRACGGKLPIIWGRPAQCIPCTYTTNDGNQHSTLLLTSGWWGQARHINYLGDLLQAFAMCSTCGLDHILPWSYFFFMVVLLVHRIERNDQRCRDKYGSKWTEYCANVPYKIFPGVY